MMFAAEVASENSYHVITSCSFEALGNRLDILLEYLDDEDIEVATGTVDCNDLETAVDAINKGDWNYSQRV